MTANIAFWRDKQHSAPAYIYRRLRCGWRLPTLEQLPVSGICNRIPEAFLQWQEELEREGLAEHGWYHAGKRRWMHRVSGAAFTLHAAPQGGWVACVGMSEGEREALRAILIGYGCAVYEPETGQFDRQRGSCPFGQPLPAGGSPEPEGGSVLEENALACLEQYRHFCREEFRFQFDEKIATGNYHAALDLCNQELAQEGGQLGIFVLRAYCNRLLRRTPQMYHDLEAAYDCCKTDVLVLRALCGTIATKSRYAKQIEYLSQLAQLDPGNADAYILHRAYCFHWTERDDAARDDLRWLLRRRDPRGYGMQDFWYLFRMLGSGKGKLVRRRAMARAARVYRGKGHRRAQVGWSCSRRRGALYRRRTGGTLLPEGWRGRRRP